MLVSGRANGAPSAVAVGADHPPCHRRLRTGASPGLRIPVLLEELEGGYGDVVLHRGVPLTGCQAIALPVRHDFVIEVAFGHLDHPRKSRPKLVVLWVCTSIAAVMLWVLQAAVCLPQHSGSRGRRRLRSTEEDLRDAVPPETRRE